MLIGGEWVDPAGGEWIESINPFTAAPWALIPRGRKEDVDRAVKAAKTAYHERRLARAYGDGARRASATVWRFGGG